MKTRHHLKILVLSGLATTCSPALGEVYTLNATGLAEELRPNFDGADQFPFLGLEKNDTVEFNFFYDTDMLPDSFDGGIAIYNFNRDDAWIRLGDSTAFFDSFTIRTGTDDDGFGYMRFNGSNTDLGLMAQLEFGSSTPFSTALPTAIDLDSADVWSSYFANSTQNQVLLPIVFGPVETATIIPAPGGAPLLSGVALGWGARRRRA